jgi:hypothetical protein
MDSESESVTEVCTEAGQSRLTRGDAVSDSDSKAAAGIVANKESMLESSVNRGTGTLDSETFEESASHLDADSTTKEPDRDASGPNKGARQVVDKKASGPDAAGGAEDASLDAEYQVINVVGYAPFLLYVATREHEIEKQPPKSVVHFRYTRMIFRPVNHVDVLMFFDDHAKFRRVVQSFLHRAFGSAVFYTVSAKDDDDQVPGFCSTLPRVRPCKNGV